MTHDQLYNLTCSPMVNQHTSATTVLTQRQSCSLTYHTNPCRALGGNGMGHVVAIAAVYWLNTFLTYKMTVLFLIMQFIVLVQIALQSDE